MNNSIEILPSSPEVIDIDDDDELSSYKDEVEVLHHEQQFLSKGKVVCKIRLDKSPRFRSLTKLQNEGKGKLTAPVKRKRKSLISGRRVHSPTDEFFRRASSDSELEEGELATTELPSIVIIDDDDKTEGNKTESVLAEAEDGESEDLSVIEIIPAKSNPKRGRPRLLTARNRKTKRRNRISASTSTNGFRCSTPTNASFTRNNNNSNSSYRLSAAKLTKKALRLKRGKKVLSKRQQKAIAYKNMLNTRISATSSTSNGNSFNNYSPMGLFKSRNQRSDDAYCPRNEMPQYRLQNCDPIGYSPMGLLKSRVQRSGDEYQAPIPIQFDYRVPRSDDICHSLESSGSGDASVAYSPLGLWKSRVPRSGGEGNRNSDNDVGLTRAGSSANGNAQVNENQNQEQPTLRLSQFGKNMYAPPAASLRKPGTLRPVVIDASNVAMAHGNNMVFSCRGIEVMVNYFKERGHTTIIAWIPHFKAKRNCPIADPEILDELKQQGILKETPGRTVGRIKIAAYDDRFIVQVAAHLGGVVISNDNFRDLYETEPLLRETIHKRVLQYNFVRSDWLMFPDDPLGRGGATLEQLLKF